MGNWREKFKEKERNKITAVCILAAVIFFLTLVRGGSLFAEDRGHDAFSVISAGKNAAEDAENAEDDEKDAKADAAGTDEGGHDMEKENADKENADTGNGKEGFITIDVAGAVSSPGILILPENTRVYEAVASAGGFTAEADLREVNQAEILLDGEKLYIPSQADYRTADSGENGSAGRANPQGQSGRRVRSVSSEKVNTSQNANSSGKVNLNTADADQLQSIRGIGPAMAERILDYRRVNGKFKSTAELKKIKGIGEKTFEKLKDHVSVT